MSSSRPVSRSMHSANAAVANKLRPRSFSSSLFMPSLFLTPKRTRRAAFFDSSTAFPSTSHEHLRTKFVDALVQAGTCKHESNLRRRRQGLVARYQSTMGTQKSREKKTGDGHRVELERSRSRVPAQRSPHTREDYLNLLDYYGMDGDTQNDPPDGDTAGHHERAYFSVTQDEDEGQHDNFSDLADSRIKPHVEALTGLLHADASKPEEIFECYLRIPSPGVRYLSSKLRMRLIRRLSILRHRSPQLTINYISVLDDMKLANLPIPKHAWNSAIHLSGKAPFRLGDPEVEVALQTWKDMETQSGVKSDTATFNILYDIASKAGKEGLAKLVQQEMKSRGLPPNQHTKHVEMFAHGLRRDGEAVRRAYREFVNSGEVVNVVTLNCLISSLIHSHEPEAAEAVFLRMISLATENEGKTYAPRLWDKQRELAKIFGWIANNPSIRPSAKEGLQSAISLAPNTRTCNLLLEHFCKRGELQRAVEMLDQMQHLRINPDNRTFLHLFQGFKKHGGVRYSTWTAQRLKVIWQSYVKLMSIDDLGLHLTKWIVVTTLQAFRKCCGAQEELEIWAEMKSRWKQAFPFEDIAPKPRDGISSWELFRR